MTQVTTTTWRCCGNQNWQIHCPERPAFGQPAVARWKKKLKVAGAHAIGTDGAASNIVPFRRDLASRRWVSYVAWPGHRPTQNIARCVHIRNGARALGLERLIALKASRGRPAAFDLSGLAWCLNWPG